MVQKRKPKAGGQITLQKLNLLIYLLVMAGVFPLFFLNQYEKIGTLKFTLFWYSSLIFLGVGITISVIRGLKVVVGEGSYPNVISINGRRFYVLKLSFMDKAMIAYGICVILSFSFSDYKEFALKGIREEYRGTISHLVMHAVNNRVDAYMEYMLRHPMEIRRYYRQFDY